MINIPETTGVRKDGIINLKPKEADELIKQGGILVDIREGNEIMNMAFDVPDIMYCSFSSFGDDYINLPNDKFLIISCAHGQRSQKAAMFLKSKGYNNIANLLGGISEWNKYGLPVK